MSKFVNGPWTATWTHPTRCAIHSSAWGAGASIIAVVHAAGNDGDFSKETAEANARLIAAAPDLYAACEAMHVRLFHEQGGQENSPWAAPLRMLSKAMAKARGE